MAQPAQQLPPRIRAIVRWLACNAARIDQIDKGTISFNVSRASVVAEIKEQEPIDLTALP